MTTKEIVERLLKENEKCRTNDKWLCYMVFDELCKEEGQGIFIPFRLFKKLPAFETISRLRRMIQNDENKFHEKIEEQPKHNYKLTKEIFVKNEQA